MNKQQILSVLYKAADTPRQALRSRFSGSTGRPKGDHPGKVNTGVPTYGNSAIPPPMGAQQPAAPAPTATAMPLAAASGVPNMSAPGAPKTAADKGVETLVGDLFAARQTLHALHLKSKDYAEHVALNEGYDALLDLIDTFVETYQGQYGIIEQAKTLTVETDADAAKYLKTLIGKIRKTREAMSAEDTHLQNILDEMLAASYHVIYKLENLGCKKSAAFEIGAMLARQIGRKQASAQRVPDKLASWNFMCKLAKEYPVITPELAKKLKIQLAAMQMQGPLGYGIMRMWHKHKYGPGDIYNPAGTAPVSPDMASPTHNEENMGPGSLVGVSDTSEPSHERAHGDNLAPQPTPSLPGKVASWNFLKRAYFVPSWGGGQVGAGFKYGPQAQLGYTNLMGLLPMPSAGLDIGGPDTGLRVGMAGPMPYVGLRAGFRESGIVPWRRNFPRGAPEMLYDKLRGRTGEEAHLHQLNKQLKRDPAGLVGHLIRMDALDGVDPAPEPEAKPKAKRQRDKAASWGFLCKQAGIFWKDLDRPVPIKSTLDTYDVDKKGKPGKHPSAKSDIYLDAERTQEPRMLTRLFSSPRDDYMALSHAISRAGVDDPYSRVGTASVSLPALWPKRYRQQTEGPGGSEADVFERMKLYQAAPEHSKAASWNFLKRAAAPGYSRAASSRLGVQRNMPVRVSGVRTGAPVLDLPPVDTAPSPPPIPARMQPAPSVVPPAVASGSRGKQASWNYLMKAAQEDLSSGSKGPTDACRVLDATQPVKKNIKIQHHDR